MSEPMNTCPFCGRDPFHYVDNGIGMQPVAVDCCEFGDLIFRGARPTPENVTLAWDEFAGIAAMLGRYRQAIEFAHAEGFQWPSDPFAADGASR